MKWKFPSRDLQVGDLVLLDDPLAPPSAWKMGRIVATYPSKSNEVRIVDLRTGKIEDVRTGKSEVVRRAARRLVPLLVDDEDLDLLPPRQAQTVHDALEEDGLLEDDEPTVPPSAPSAAPTGLTQVPDTTLVSPAPQSPVADTQASVDNVKLPRENRRQVAKAKSSPGQSNAPDAAADPGPADQGPANAPAPLRRSRRIRDQQTHLVTTVLMFWLSFVRPAASLFIHPLLPGIHA